MIHLRRHTEASSQQSFLRNVCLGTGPACKHEGDLVHKICNVVDHIEVDLIHGSEEVAEKVAKRVNRPTQRDDEAHVVERARDGRAAIFNRATCFASEDLEEDESPTAHAHGEALECWDCANLAEIRRGASEQCHPEASRTSQ